MLEKNDEIIARWRKFFPTKVLPHEIFPDKVIVFPKSVVTRWKYALFSISMQKPQSVSLKNIFADSIDLAFTGQITFSRNFGNNWNKNVNFKIILIGENSFLQMYRNKMSFLTYWFLRIKWLFAKSVEITFQKNS